MKTLDIISSVFIHFRGIYEKEIIYESDDR